LTPSGGLRAAVVFCEDDQCCLFMCKSRKKVVCKSHPEQLDVLSRWRDALEGSNKEMAYDLMNQVLDGKITNDTALALLDNKRDEGC